MKNCFECRFKSTLKTMLNSFDFMFPDRKLTEKALEKKKEIRKLILDNMHQLFTLSREGSE